MYLNFKCIVRSAGIDPLNEISLIHFIFPFSEFRSHSAAFVLALIITIALIVTRNDDENVDGSSVQDPNNPGRSFNANEFQLLMKTFDGPIDG